MDGTIHPRPAVFLDRDDTLIVNRALEPPQPRPPCWQPGDLADPARVQLVPHALDACRRLKRAGFVLVVVTNQGIVARGGASHDDVRRTNEALCAQLHDRGEPLIDAVYVCPYHPLGSVPDLAREHPWRKPAPGMMLTAARELGLDLTRSWVIGDAERDAAAGRAAGIAADRCLVLGSAGGPADLPAAVEFILARLASVAS